MQNDFDLYWQRLMAPIRALEQRVAALESRPSRAEEAGGVAVVDTLPAAGVPGRILFRTTDKKFYGDTGAAWVAFH